jgi:hypothetical protein
MLLNRFVCTCARLLPRFMTSYDRCSKLLAHRRVNYQTQIMNTIRSALKNILNLYLENMRRCTDEYCETYKRNDVVSYQSLSYFLFFAWSTLHSSHAYTLFSCRSLTAKCERNVMKMLLLIQDKDPTGFRTPRWRSLCYLPGNNNAVRT